MRESRELAGDVRPSGGRSSRRRLARRPTRSRVGWELLLAVHAHNIGGEQFGLEFFVRACAPSTGGVVEMQLQKLAVAFVLPWSELVG